VGAAGGDKKMRLACDRGQRVALRLGPLVLLTTVVLTRLVWNIGRMILAGKKRSTRNKSYASVTSPATQPTWTDVLEHVSPP
jgi:uncharacterized protein (DUF2062 family)